MILVKHLDKLIGHFASAGAYHPPGLRLCQCRLNYTMRLFWKTNADPVTCDGKFKRVFVPRDQVSLYLSFTVLGMGYLLATHCCPDKLALNGPKSLTHDVRF